MQHIRQQNQPKNKLANPFEAQKYYECNHCGVFFVPRKRFVQKYCSESCRVMACRDRKDKEPVRNHHHLNGNPSSVQNRPEKQSKSQIQNAAIKEILAELKDFLDERDKKLIKKLSVIHSNQRYHMLISSIAPLVAEPLRQKFLGMIKGGNQPRNQSELLKGLEPITKDLPPELQNLLTQTAVSYLETNGQNSKMNDLHAL